MHARVILIIEFILGILLIKYKGKEIITNEITYPNVGDNPNWNPANIGKIKPRAKYKEVITNVSIKEAAVKPIINKINNCNETFIFSPSGIENIPITHKIANNIAFLHILFTVKKFPMLIIIAK